MLFLFELILKLISSLLSFNTITTILLSSVMNATLGNSEELDEFIRFEPGGTNLETWPIA